jgi:hypothetical protein
VNFANFVNFAIAPANAAAEEIASRVARYTRVTASAAQAP